MENESYAQIIDTTATLIWLGAWFLMVVSVYFGIRQARLNDKEEYESRS